jgi:fructokinase
VIVVAGESLVDLIAQPGGVLAPLPGGGPFNVARALARLEAPVAFLGAVSDDRFGRRLRETLAADGVDDRCLVPVDRPTMLAVAELDDAGVAHYRFYADGTAAPALEAEAALAAMARVPVEALVVGALGLALEPMATAVQTLVAAAGPETLVLVDPNWRPEAVPDPAAWRHRLGAVLRRADVVKVSTDDLLHLAPGVDAVRAARGLLDGGGARCVLVTDGPHDVVAVTPDAELRVTPPRARVVDTVGAGDSFCAGFLAWWRSNGLGRADLGEAAALRGAVTFAARVAARACERAGADPPSLRELEAVHLAV